MPHMELRSPWKQSKGIKLDMQYVAVSRNQGKLSEVKSEEAVVGSGRSKQIHTNTQRQDPKNCLVYSHILFNEVGTF